MEKSQKDSPKVPGSLDKQLSYDVGEVSSPIDIREGEPISTHNGQLRRSFKARHMQMIALGGCIGSGLFISSGKALNYGGAAAMILGYTLIAALGLATMHVLSEATCILPTPGSFIDHAARFVDPAMGFATGFLEWFAWMTVAASEGSVVRIILTYWTTSIPTAATMAVYLLLVFGIHSLPNIWFAEFEFGTSSLKVISIITIIITCICIVAGAGDSPPVEYAWNYTEAPAFPNGFKGLCSTFTMAAWAIGGQEIMGLTAGEAKFPRWDMPRACNSLFARVLIFFELSILLITLLVPYTDSRLLSSSTVASSPFVIAMDNAGIKYLPDLLNAVILLGLVAIGAEALYISSRCMTGMAKLGLFPEICGRVDKKGRPYVALTITAIGSTICTFINCSGTGGVIFTWFSSISSTNYFMTWMVIAITNVQMRKAIKLQKDDCWKLPYSWKLSTYPAMTSFLFFATLLVVILTGYVALFPIGESHADVVSFFQIFLGVPMWFVAYFAYKLFYRTKFIDPAKADLQTGRLYLTDEDIAFMDAYYAQPLWKRALSYVRF